jgi:ketosteroid isomerase-like protein
MAATTQECQAIVVKFVNANLEGRLDDSRSLLHDEFVVREAGGVPYSGDYHGPQGFFELFMKINDVLELTPDPAIQYLVADDTVAMRYRLTFTSRASGKSVEMDVVEVFSIRDGLIVELDVFYRDPSAVKALLEA